MDIIFENSYTRTNELAKEIYQYIYYKRPIYIFFDIVLGLGFFANLATLIFEQYCNVSVFVTVALFFTLQFYLYFKSVKNLLKRDQEITNGNAICVNIIVTNDFILNTSSTGSVNEIPFSKIKKAIQTKNLILIRSEANLLYIFRKDSFTKGNASEFITYLNQKGFKMKQ